MYESQNIQSALSRIQNQQIQEKFNRSGFYRAVVVANDDPLNLGRVKVRIPALHGVDSNLASYVPDTALPYAFPGALPGAGYLEGPYLLPSQGHTVWVSFEAGTTNLIYFGGIYSKEPETEKLIYKGRLVNNGDPIKVYSDDIPTDYNPNRHVLYRSWSGDIIYIDEQRSGNAITIENRYGTAIRLGDGTVNIISENPVNAYLPHTVAYYSDAGLIDGTDFEITRDDIFTDVSFTERTSSIYRGSMIMFVKNGSVTGTGFIIESRSDAVHIRMVSTISEGGTGPGGTTNYNELENLPSLNDITFQGNRNVAETPLSNIEIESLLR